MDDFEGESVLDARLRISDDRMLLDEYTSSSDDADGKQGSDAVIPLWRDSDSATEATETEEEEDEDVGLIADRPQGVIRRRRSFNRHNERDNPIREKKLSEMTDRERNRSARSYVHPTSCCKRKQCYLSLSAEMIRELRVRVWNDSSMNQQRKRTEIQRLWDELLQVDGKPCCVDFVCKAFGVSKMYIYGDSRNDRTKIRLAKKTEAAIAFFDQLRRENDKMPNKQEYQLYAPKKKEIWRWYCNQVGEVIPISKPFFFQLWKKYAPDLKLRKYLKFTICKECKELKQVHLM